MSRRAADLTAPPACGTLSHILSRAARPFRLVQRPGGSMEASGNEGGRGLRRNAVGLPGLIAQSLGVTAPEISAVVIAAVAASRVGGFTPAGVLRAGPRGIRLA